MGCDGGERGAFVKSERDQRASWKKVSRNEVQLSQSETWGVPAVAAYHLVDYYHSALRYQHA